MSYSNYYDKSQLQGDVQNTRTMPPITEPARPIPEAPLQESYSELTRWGKTGRILSMPVGVTESIVQGVGESAGQLLAGRGIEGVKESIGKATRQIGRTATLKESHSFQEVFNSPASILKGKAGKTVGFVADVVLDPLSYLTSGLTTAGKVAKSLTSLTEEGRILLAAGKDASKIFVRVDSPIAKSAKSLYQAGKPTELLKTGIEQAQAGQRGLKFAGKSVAPEWFNVGWEKMKGYIGTGLEKTGVPSIVRKTFSTSTGNKIADTVETTSREILNMRNSILSQRVQNILPIYNKLSDKSKILVTKTLEDGNLITKLSNDELTAYHRMDAFRTMITDLRGKGYMDDILRDEPALVADWFPHVQKPTNSVPFFKRIFSKTEELPGKQYYGGGTAKIHGTPGSVEASGKIGKFTPTQNVSGTAKEIITMPEKQGLKLLEDGSWVDKLGNVYERTRPSVFEANDAIEAWNKGYAPNQQIAKFETNPIIAFTQRGLDESKAVTSREYISQMRQFGKTAEDAPVNWQTVTLKDGKMLQGLEDLRFSPEMAANIDKVRKGWQPEEINKFMKAYSSFSGLWRAQALLSPAYHSRNSVSNKWSNFLAGIYNPVYYNQAKNLQLGKEIKPFVDKFGRRWTSADVLKAAKENGILNLGQTAQEVTEDIQKTLFQSRRSQLNPLNKDNILLQANRHVGAAIENNDRLAHFIGKLQQGDGVLDASRSVKKYLFDYSDLTDIEKNLFKNVTLFYTWTRKNIPLQLHELTQQPGKFAGVFKATNAIEQGAEKPSDEKYLNDYIKENSPIRLKTNEDGTTEYFLLGNWLPAAQAIDFLSQPKQNMLSMIAPYFKIPVELWSNQSSFFTNSLGQPSLLESTPSSMTSFLGINMRGKLAAVLKNIRVLNDLNRLNPGEIFGGEDKATKIQFSATSISTMAEGFGIKDNEAIDKLSSMFGVIAPAQESKSQATLHEDSFKRFLNYVFGGQIQRYNAAEQAGYGISAERGQNKDILKSIRKAGNTPYGIKLMEEYQESLKGNE